MTQPKSAKRDALLEILDGHAELDSPIVDRSALGFIAGQEQPVIHSSLMMWALGIPLLLVLCTAFIFTFDYVKDSPLAVAGCVSVMITIIATMIFITQQRRVAFRGLVNALQEPLAELRELQEYLNGYIAGLDNRTSRYFHCVTNTKVTAYFVLTQINTTLHTRIKEISEQLAKPTHESALAAYRYLRGSLIFSDGVLAGSGDTHAVPLVRLNVTITKLIENLELGLSELEKELTHSEQLIRGKE